jgi:tetraprenyl-beta-curcumene synthase
MAQALAQRTGVRQSVQAPLWRPAPVRRRTAVAGLQALALAHALYWPSVAPVVAGELTRWGQAAERINDPALRALALAKLTQEHFNAQVAATLATLAPRNARTPAVRAIVALELLFDYLDGRTELPCGDPIGEGARLFEAFTGALTCTPGTRERADAVTLGDNERVPDREYLQALGDRAREQMYGLPAAQRVNEVARESAARCASAQTLLHAGAILGDRPLREWACEQSPSSGLGWREYAAGSASSVLAVHALIAAAADPQTTTGGARRINAAYLAIGAVITLLDSLVDETVDAARGEPGFIRLYDTREQLARELCALTREALERAHEAPHGKHHAMTLAGVVAYYTTHPGAREPHARGLVAAVRRELSPTVWPALAVMHSWRAAKRARAAGERWHGQRTVIE